MVRPFLGLTVPNEHHADGKGVCLLRNIRRLDLKANIRASEDPAHVQYIREMRDVNSEQPVSDKLIRSFNLLTKEAVHKHGNTLRFASIAVLSQRERHPLNLCQARLFARTYNKPLFKCQARLFARTYNKPLFKWKLPLSGPVASWITKEEEGLIYKHEEAGVYGYFVEGAPCVVLRNLLTNRTLVNVFALASSRRRCRRFGRR